MKIGRALLLVAVGGLALARGAEGWLDRLDETLTTSSVDGAFRARVSGTLDLEGYRFSQPAPALIDAGGRALFNPRLTTFLDAQYAAIFYAFAQARVDRAFDPADESVGARLDEYAVRFTPRSDGRFSIQAGKFATVVGNWVQRHGSWDNPFITAPLPYENLTGLWDAAAATTSGTLLGWAHVLPRPPTLAPTTEKYLRLPIIWGPSYARGIAVSGLVGRLSYSLEMKNASLSSRPSTWNDEDVFSGHRTVSGRMGYRPNAMWNFGFSLSDGTYLNRSAAPTLAASRNLSDYRQSVVAQDVSFAWHHLQIWAEWFESRYAVPGVGVPSTLAYYVEARYKVTPRFSAAVRWNEQTYSRLEHGGGLVRWGAKVSRLDVAPTFRFTAQSEVKLQYSLQREELARSRLQQTFAAQLVVKF